MFKLIILLFFFGADCVLSQELWEKDMTSAMKIGLSTTGYKSVNLVCGAEHFLVNVTLNNDFEGVVYTRGNFNDKKLPCFKRHDQSYLRDYKLIISMRIPFNKCRTVMDVAESCYSNTIVVQHDQDLIMPGDAAFNLDCSFEPEFRVSTDMTAETSKDTSFKSKISLVSADPAEKTGSKELKYVASSDTDNVTFYPTSIVTDTKDEL